MIAFRGAPVHASRIAMCLVFAIAAVLNGAILWYFHDRYWYPTDDGFYANIAERLLSGEVLTKDIQDLHPGYIHFLNAGAMRLFGIDLVSPRYPLILAAWAQSSLVLVFLARRGLAVALAGSIASTALGVVQFVNPTPNWYCLMFAIAIGAWMTWVPADRRHRLVVVGVLLGLSTMFRQLSGVWTAMAVLVIALLEERRVSEDGATPLLARGLLALMLVALIGYLVLSPETEPGGLILFAAWPIAILVWMLARVRTSNGATLVVVARTGAGVILAAAPLVLYHVVHGSIGALFRDTVVAGFNETQMAFFGQGWYGVLPIAGLIQAASSFEAWKIANGLYWMILPLLSAINGFCVLRAIRRGAGADEFALPVIAMFYSLVSLYLEGPLYLYYSAGLSLVGVAWQMSTSARRKVLIATAIAAIAWVGIRGHAGQPRTRTSIQILRGDRVIEPTGLDNQLPRSSLRIGDADRKAYQQLVTLIQSQSAPGDSILALPNDAELYFLAERRNPVRFYNSALGVQTSEELAIVLRILETNPPRLVMFRSTDKYNNAESHAIMEFVRSRYDRRTTVAGLEVYVAR